MQSSDVPPARSHRRDDPFPSTHWSVILAAGEDISAASAALETLCRGYWHPVYAYLRRRSPTRDAAQDLTQAFFVHFLEKRSFDRADPARGRFRAFLLTAVKNFLNNEDKKARALKRGGGAPVFSLDFEAAESRCRLDPCNGHTPDREFDRRWAVALLEQVLERLRREHVEAGKAEQFERLSPFLTGQSPSTYGDVASELKVTEQAARAAAFRLRQRYRRLLRAAIADTVASSDEIEDELRGLFDALKS